jgi:hypothetical protein
MLGGAPASGRATPGLGRPAGRHAPHSRRLPARLLIEALTRLELLQALADRTPAGELTEAVDVAVQVTDSYLRTQLLTALAPLLPDGQRQQIWTEALTATHIARRYYMGGHQRELAESLPAGLSADQLTEALTVARQAADLEGQARLLAALPPRQAARMWLDILPILPRHRRPDILEDIPFLLAQLPDTGNRPQTARIVAEAVIAAGGWWS